MMPDIEMKAKRTSSQALMRGIGALALTASLSACSSGGEPGELPRSREAVSVSVSPVVTLPATGAHPATVEATRRASLATRTSGRIERFEADVGSRVAAGDLLVAVDDGDVRARIEAAESAARLARKTHERIQALAAEGAASEQELDEARTRAEAAEADLRSARAQMDYTRITAPFDGVVTARTADPGDLAAPGRPLLTLVGYEGRKVVADLPAGLGGRVAAGDSARVVDPRTGREVTVRFSRVSPAVSPSARRFRVEAELPSSAELLPGTFVRLVLGEAGEMTRWIPADAVVRRGQLTGVFTVEDERLRLRWIRPGAVRPGGVELLAGPGGPVVRDPGATFHDGQPVASLTETPWNGPDQGEADR